MLFKTKGIVINKINYSDTSVIAKIYTEKFGMQSYIINLPKKNKNSTKHILVQPLSLIDMVVYYKESSHIHRIKEIETAYQFTSIPYDIFKSSMIVFVNEIIYKSIREIEQNETLFNFLFHNIQLLDLLKDDFIDFHLFFCLNLTKHLGFFPNNNYSEDYKFFDMVDGTFRNAPPLNNSYLSEETSYNLNKLINLSIENNLKLNITNIQRKELLNALISYYRIHIANFGEIKSIYVLEMLFK